jgi:hypothetical protein
MKTYSSTWAGMQAAAITGRSCIGLEPTDPIDRGYGEPLIYVR